VRGTGPEDLLQGVVAKSRIRTRGVSGPRGREAGGPTLDPWAALDDDGLAWRRRCIMAEDTDKLLSDEERKAVFLALVELQDDEMPVAASRKAVAERFSIPEHRVRLIERKGLDARWPPLG
jgi:hypothetical protein